MINELLDSVHARLQAMDVHDVRKICRRFGIVLHSNNQKKDELIEGLMKIATGGAVPPKRSNKGAKPKSLEYDTALADDIEICRSAALGEQIPQKKEEVIHVSHVKNIDDGFFDGEHICVDGFSGTILPDEALWGHCELRVGDHLKLGVVKGGDCYEIIKINGEPPKKFRKSFTDLSRVYPDTKIELSGSVERDVVNIVCPLAMGQRVMICGGMNTGKSSLLRSILYNIDKSFVKIFLLLYGAQEDIADCKRNFDGELYSTAFEKPLAEHVTAVRLVGEYALRLVELGKDVILAVDGLDNLLRSGSGVAIGEAKKLFSSACNIEGGGSVTVIAATEGGAADELTRFADNNISLSVELARKRVFPAIDVMSCFSDRAEKFTSADDLDLARRICRQASKCGDEYVIDLFRNCDGDKRALTKVLEG